MPCRLVSIVGTALSITLVPACNPLLRQPPPNDLPASPILKREEPTNSSQAGAMPDTPHHPGPAEPEVKPAVGNEILIEQVRYPALGSGSDLIPEPRNPAESSAAARVIPSPEQDTAAESHPDAKAKPAEDPPLVQAVRCLLDKRPAEAVAWLERYDKPSQELLMRFLALAVRLTEEGWQRCDSREASAMLAQLDRVAAPLHRRAPLRIKKMYLCSEVEGYGKYRPWPESHGFLPGESVYVYVELQNLADEWQGKAYSFHLLTNIEIRDFNGNTGWRYSFHDPGPDISLTERHDFYHLCTFHIPKDHPRITPGLYTLYVKITDKATGREVDRTLDFRVGSAYARNGW
jgi:hypothetical protein